MAYRFRMEEPVEAGVRRIACEQIDEALAVIASGDLPLERVVHEVRRRCKALRALIRLVRPVFPAFDQENAVFRDIARSLAGSRDGKVLADTLDDLADDADEAGQRLITRLRKRFAQPKEKAGAIRLTLDTCASLLRAARERAGHWSLEAEGWDALSGGFTKTIKSARRVMKSLAASDDAERSHEWRKHVKYHWHHVRLLRAAGPDAASDRVRQSERLAELLGDRHDLDLFCEALAAQSRRGTEAPIMDLFAAKARKRANKLEAKAARLGEQLFDEKPHKLAAKWGERWRSQAKEALFA